MQRTDDATIDLGSVVEETKGPNGQPFDTQGNLLQSGGISDD